MKTLIVAAAIALGAAGANAHDVYRGLAEGSPELNDQHLTGDLMVGAQPGIGTATDTYRGFAEGNADLFPAAIPTQDYGPTAGRSPDVYQNLCSQDLAC
ncbi:MAG: hypothetical protein WAM94_14990 [Chromatiaceae bacterium]